MTSHRFTDGAPETLADVAYRRIKRDIIRCDLQPDGHVTESQLAERYGIGRAAVRSALNRLSQERLVQAIPRHGYLVAPVTLGHVNDLLAVRELVEPEAARLAALQINEEELERLNQLGQVRYEPGDRDSAEQFLQCNREFHIVIAYASRNERLAEIVISLRDEMERLYHLGHMLHDRNERGQRDNQALVEALRAGDAKRAERIAREHIQASRRLVMDVLISSPSLQKVNLVLDASQYS